MLKALAWQGSIVLQDSLYRSLEAKSDLVPKSEKKKRGLIQVSRMRCQVRNSRLGQSPDNSKYSSHSGLVERIGRGGGVYSTLQEAC